MSSKAAAAGRVPRDSDWLGGFTGNRRGKRRTGSADQLDSKTAGITGVVG